MICIYIKEINQCQITNSLAKIRNENSIVYNAARSMQSRKACGKV